MPKASNSVKHRNLICFSKKLQQIFVYFQFFIMYPIIEACRLEFYSGFDSLKFMRKSLINKQITFCINESIYRGNFCSSCALVVTLKAGYGSHSLTNWNQMCTADLHLVEEMVVIGLTIMLHILNFLFQKFILNNVAFINWLMR